MTTEHNANLEESLSRMAEKMTREALIKAIIDNDFRGVIETQEMDRSELQGSYVVGMLKLA